MKAVGIFFDWLDKNIDRPKVRNTTLMILGALLLTVVIVFCNLPTH